VGDTGIDPVTSAVKVSVQFQARFGSCDDVGEGPGQSAFLPPIGGRWFSPFFVLMQPECGSFHPTWSMTSPMPSTPDS